ncbi:deoxyribodipyrimidine photo-lyase [Pontiellaceae bacterium B1224]|nr:deoxyribodipyrimidine photo-lyase [Pontiellaceae bacterium B1224]
MKISIHWFRNDLRLTDNPALIQAAEAGIVLPVFIWDAECAAELGPGGASRWWLHHSLVQLNDSLGGALNIYCGNPQDVLATLAKEHAVDQVCWNHSYEPQSPQRDEAVAEEMRSSGRDVQTFNGSLLWDPEEVLKADGTPYKVFTPFYKRGCLNAMPPRKPQKAQRVRYQKASDSLSVDDLGLLPKIAWDAEFSNHWKPGEAGALQALRHFLAEGIGDYKDGRNFPAKKKTSRLSPHLHWGEISVNQVWYAAREFLPSEQVDVFCSELGWREFSACLLFHFPNLPSENLNRQFDAFPWEHNEAWLLAWQKGQTGIPLVDAGMRELWRTGFMHNRVRMVAASFLVKNLLIHWHHGADWFRDTLVDADLANNSASWQWVAGCGADAAPYFRIFNPVTQGKKFDPAGEYIRTNVPELGNLPNKYLFSPWEAPEAVLGEAGVELGKTYPKPIVDLKESRQHALAAYAMLKARDTSSEPC